MWCWRHTARVKITAATQADNERAVSVKCANECARRSASVVKVEGPGGGSLFLATDIWKLMDEESSFLPPSPKRSRGSSRLFFSLHQSTASYSRCDHLRQANRYFFPIVFLYTVMKNTFLHIQAVVSIWESLYLWLSETNFT